jgi:hypothetical protein
MPQFTSTKQMVAFELAKLEEITDINKILRKAAFDSLDMVASRVQQQGNDANDSKMESKSDKKFGAYSEPYGKVRKRKGFQTSIIDFTFTGDLWEGWRVFPLSKKSIGVGFFGQEVEKARWLEKMFGEVFVLTKEEEADILALVTFETNKILNK